MPNMKLGTLCTGLSSTIIKKLTRLQWAVRRSLQLTFQNQIPHAASFRFRRFRCRFRLPPFSRFRRFRRFRFRFRLPPFLPDSADSADSVSDSACHLFARFRRFRFRFRMPPFSSDSADSACLFRRPLAFRFSSGSERAWNGVNFPWERTAVGEGKAGARNRTAKPAFEKF